MVFYVPNTLFLTKFFFFGKSLYGYKIGTVFSFLSKVRIAHLPGEKTTKQGERLSSPV